MSTLDVSQDLDTSLSHVQQLWLISGTRDRNERQTLGPV